MGAVEIVPGVLGMGLPVSAKGDWRESGPPNGRRRRAFGLHRVELTVREDNSGAIELYEKVGFEIEGRQRDAVHVDGAHENSICMALLF